MTSYSSCVAFTDMKCSLRIHECIYLTLSDGGNDFEVTLNPNQAKLLGESLISAAGKVPVSDLERAGCSLYGGIEFEYEEVRKEADSNEPDHRDNFRCIGDNTEEQETVKIA